MPTLTPHVVVCPCASMVISPLFTQAVDQSTAIPRLHYEILCCLSLGEAQLLAGRLNEAHAVTEYALVHAREHQERGHEAYALRLFGDIAAHRDPLEFERAESHYGQALALAGVLGIRPLQAHCHRGLGTLYSETGQRAQAHTELLEAIALYRAMAMTFWLPQTEAALAAVQGDAERCSG